MQGVARHFFTLAIFYALCGMALGIAMAISEDHSQMPTHAHIIAAGWLMSAVFSFFYQLVPAARTSRLAPFHFWLSALSGIGLMGGLFFLMRGDTWIEPIVGVASIGFYGGILLFAVIALPAVWRSDRADAQSPQFSLNTGR